MIRTIEENRLCRDIETFSKEVQVVARGDEKLLVCCGPPGVGKTHEAERGIRHARVPLRSAAPASVRGFVNVLRSARGVLLLDDKDFLFRRLDFLSILKVVCDPLDGRVIPYDSAAGSPPFRPRCGIIVSSNSDLTDLSQFESRLRPHVEALMSRGSLLRLSFDPVDAYDFSVWLALEQDLLARFGSNAANLALRYFGENAARLRERSPRSLMTIARWASHSPSIWKRHFDRQLLEKPIDFPPVEPDQIRPRRQPRPKAASKPPSEDGDDTDPRTGGGVRPNCADRRLDTPTNSGNETPSSVGAVGRRPTASDAEPARAIQRLSGVGRTRQEAAVAPERADSGVRGCTHIYAPPGRAGEYAALAANPYRGCGHACAYCYVPAAVRMTRETFDAGAKPRPDFLHHLHRDAQIYRDAGIVEQVMLSFTSDPYHVGDTTLTTRTLEILIDHGLSFCTLTKGGLRALCDLSLFRPTRDAFASTLTSLDDDFSRKWERRAALPGERLAALKTFHDAGIFTWVSLEPTLSPEHSLAVVKATHEFVDLFKVGRANYLKSVTKHIDWRDYTVRMIELLNSLGKVHYIKKDLQEFLPADYHNPLRVPQHH